jgi:hypothetical protein
VFTRASRVFYAEPYTSIIKADQEVVAEIGTSATIEKLTGHAFVSLTTIYKYFTKKRRFSPRL